MAHKPRLHAHKSRGMCREFLGMWPTKPRLMPTKFVAHAVNFQACGTQNPSSCTQKLWHVPQIFRHVAHKPLVYSHKIENDQKIFLTIT